MPADVVAQRATSRLVHGAVEQHVFDGVWHLAGQALGVAGRLRCWHTATSRAPRPHADARLAAEELVAQLPEVRTTEAQASTQLAEQGGLGGEVHGWIPAADAEACTPAGMVRL